MEHVRSTPSLPLLLVADGIFGRPFHILVHPRIFQSLFDSRSRTKHVLRKSMPNRERELIFVWSSGGGRVSGDDRIHHWPLVYSIVFFRPPIWTIQQPRDPSIPFDLYHGLSSLWRPANKRQTLFSLTISIDVPLKLFTFIRIVFCPLGQDLGHPKIGPLELVLILIRISRNKWSLHTTAGGDLLSGLIFQCSFRLNPSDHFRADRHHPNHRKLIFDSIQQDFPVHHTPYTPCHGLGHSFDHPSPSFLPCQKRTRIRASNFLDSRVQGGWPSQPIQRCLRRSSDLAVTERRGGGRRGMDLQAVDHPGCYPSVRPHAGLVRWAAIGHSQGRVRGLGRAPFDDDPVWTARSWACAKDVQVSSGRPCSAGWCSAPGGGPMRWTQARAHRNVLRSDGTPLVREEADPVDRQPNPLQVELHDETLGGPDHSLAKSCLLPTAHGLVSHCRHVRQGRVGQLKGRELDLVERLVDPRQVRSRCACTRSIPASCTALQNAVLAVTRVASDAPWSPSGSQLTPHLDSPGPVHRTFCPRWKRSTRRRRPVSAVDTGFSKANQVFTIRSIPFLTSVQGRRGKEVDAVFFKRVHQKATGLDPTRHASVHVFWCQEGFGRVLKLVHAASRGRVSTSQGIFSSLTSPTGLVFLPASCGILGSTWLSSHPQWNSKGDLSTRSIISHHVCQPLAGFTHETKGEGR